MRPLASIFSKLDRIGLQRSNGAYVCPACSSSRRASSRSLLGRASTRISGPRTAFDRKASSVVSKTAVNATKDIPPRNRTLYDAITALKQEAANYVDLSRLQLALRSLESDNPVVRIAVLGDGRTLEARRLVGNLLADPLTPEAQWERKLRIAQDSDARATLLQFGEDYEIVSETPVLSTLAVPASLLASHNIEILISSFSPVNAASASDGIATDIRRNPLLVPSLEYTTPGSSNFTSVRYPVHRTLVLGHGLDSCLAFGPLIGTQLQSRSGEALMKLAISMPTPKGGPPPTDGTSGITVADIDLAASALSKFRLTTENATVYEQDWFSSGMPPILEWLSQDKLAESEGIKPAVYALVDSLLEDALHQVTRADANRTLSSDSSLNPNASQASLNEALRIWAERAHTELRDRLDSAFGSLTWQKLAWWKLFWRVDDAEMIATDVLDRAWLVNAEKEMIWLAGRIQESDVPLINDGVWRFDVETRGSDIKPPIATVTTPPAPSFADLTAAADQKSTLTERTPPLPSHGLWPVQINLARSQLSDTTVPALQALAQNLLLQTLSTAALSSALSALVYVSFPTASIYEAGAIAALGLVWSLRRLQTRWEAACRRWEADVREEGRKALKSTQAALHRVLNRTREPVVSVEAAERSKAREAILRARDQLEGIKLVSAEK
ncbi:MAG: hypothetical protein M1825_001784 [Sarcosagium campestre]|nr:MAG: hypothetical protein M1825_001784 [Sarcosagium campestre]